MFLSNLRRQRLQTTTNFRDNYDVSAEVAQDTIFHFHHVDTPFSMSLGNHLATVPTSFRKMGAITESLSYAHLHLTIDLKEIYTVPPPVQEQEIHLVKRED